jgi:tRNA (guanine-N7-)-methyltransferase
MRLRKIKDARERLCQNNNKYFINDLENLKGKFPNIFNNSNPIHIEIGCGKGKFIVENALKHPEINFIAVEKFDSVLLRCLEKALEYDLDNLKLINVDALELGTYFKEKSLDVIYLNFSDPWPKSHHAKRRLTSPIFLEIYKKILKDDGVIYQKTDNRILFAYSLESISNNGFSISNISLDLHKDLENENNKLENIETEYEEKFGINGPIYRLEARKVLKND